MPDGLYPLRRALPIKHLLAAPLQRRAVTLSLLLQKVTHGLNVFQHRIQFDHLLLFQTSPTD